MPDMREKVEEYIKELEVEVDRLASEAEQDMQNHKLFGISCCLQTRIDAYTNVINDLRNRLREVV